MFKIDMPAGVRYIIRCLRCVGYNANIVGGCVRDSLLHIEPHDWDICTSATPIEVCTLLAKHGIKTIGTGLKHGTVTACWNSETNECYEITTFRIDSEYSDNRRPDHVDFVCDIMEDLSRRDFTINAMAYSEWDGLVDPWGGCGDLWNGIVRCVRNPDDRFREDALRILRALRFASTYGFEIEKETSNAIHRNKGLLKNISAERIRSELIKILCGKGVLDILLEYSDVMTVIIPELEPCIGFDQNNRFHKYTVYEHIVHAVDNFKGSDVSINMALLLHDIGKPECYTEDENGGHFHGHGVNSMRIAKDVVERLRFDNQTKNEIVDLVLYHDADIHPSVNAVRRWMNRLGPELLNKLMFVKIADISAHSKINQEERRNQYLFVKLIAEQIMAEQQCFQLKDLAVNGRDIMNLGVDTGPIVGKVLNHLLDMVLDGNIENDRDVLIKEAEKYLNGPAISDVEGICE